MKYKSYSEADKALMWDRWKKGDSMVTMAHLFDKEHSSVQTILQKAGGIRPAQRRRSDRALSLAEREEISRGLVAGLSLRSIGTLAGEAQRGCSTA